MNYVKEKFDNDLESIWFKFNKNNLYEFINYLDTIYFWKSISKFDYTLIKQTLKKFYLFDNWFLNAISFNFSDNYWKLLENIVFIELYRKYGKNIFFLKNWSETDFIINWRENLIYQVCHTLIEENYDREIAWCIDAMNKFWVNNSILITSEQEKIININWKNIEVIPFYKWSLDSRSKS